MIYSRNCACVRKSKNSYLRILKFLNEVLLKSKMQVKLEPFACKNDSVNLSYGAQLNQFFLGVTETLDKVILITPFLQIKRWYKQLKSYVRIYVHKGGLNIYVSILEVSNLSNKTCNTFVERTIIKIFMIQYLNCSIQLPLKERNYFRMTRLSMPSPFLKGIRAYSLE